MQEETSKAAEQQALLDPVCGMQVSSDSEYRHTHSGSEYLFCSESCANKFKTNPGQYITSGEEDSAHPEKQIDPVCGMEVSQNAELHHEHDGTTYRFCSEPNTSLLRILHSM